MTLYCTGGRNDNGIRDGHQCPQCSCYWRRGFIYPYNYEYICSYGGQNLSACDNMNNLLHDWYRWWYYVYNYWYMYRNSEEEWIQDLREGWRNDYLNPIAEAYNYVYNFARYDSSMWCNCYVGWEHYNTISLV
jgi:hypothetical protein